MDNSKKRKLSNESGSENGDFPAGEESSVGGNETSVELYSTDQKVCVQKKICHF